MPPTTIPAAFTHAQARKLGISDRDLANLTATITIGIYSPARSIIDTYRLRHRLGIDLAHTALRSWLNQRGNHPSELLELARSFSRAKSALHAAIEILH